MSRLQIETDLQTAIGRGEFSVLYQPILSLGARTIEGFEALARWHHPTRGWISPAEFIPIAEDIGMIKQLGRFILEASCRQMASWQRQFGRVAPGVMCVNVSAGELGPDFAADVEQMLRETGLEPSRLKLEITESAFIKDDGGAEATLARLQSIGVKWSIDDFGTGYSSLSYSVPAQGEYREDRSFVRQPDRRRCQGIGDGPRDYRAGGSTLVWMSWPKAWRHSSRWSSCKRSAAIVPRASIFRAPSISRRQTT